MNSTEALRVSELRYRRLFETARDGILILDNETGMVVDVNPFLIELLGYSREAFLGKKVWELGFLKDLVGNQANFAELQQKEYIRYEDKPLETSDGRRIEVEFVCNVYQCGDKRVTQCNIRNMTQHNMAQRTAVRLAAIVESSDDAIIGKDLDGKIQSWNAGAEKLFGYSAGEMVGRPITPLIPAELLEEELSILEKIKSGESVPHFETVRLAKEGRRVDVSVTVSPIRDPAGRVVGAAKVVRDITARRRDEEQLRKLSCAVEQSPAAVMITDVTGRIEYVNRTFTQVTGYSLEETLGKNPRMLKSGRMSVEAYRDLWAAITTGQIWRGELENRKKNGQLFWERDTISPLLDQAGKVTHYIAIMEDITGSKRAEEKIRQLNNELEQRVIERTAQLEAANKELEAFTYSVSHDLRAPLRAVDGFSKIVLEDYGPQLPQGCRQDLQTIRNGAQRMGELIDDLLAFSRLSRLPLSKQAVDTGKLVRGALEELNCQQNGRRIEFRVASLPPCHADPALLKQVWVNLLSNALKYTGKCEAAVVEIGCATENGRNVWFVRDNGTGFDMKYAHKLFGVFQRLHRAEDYEGTGVGLAIVQRIIHRHGGRVWAESGVNRGATFYFTLEGETKP